MVRVEALFLEPDVFIELDGTFGGGRELYLVDADCLVV